MQCIGYLRDHALMYFAPQTIPDTMTPDQLREQFAVVAARVTAPWILVINCQGASPTLLTAARRVNEILRADYSDRIRITWLMNAPAILRGFLKMFTAPGEEAAITFLETDRLGLFIQLQRAGCSHALVDWFIQRLPGAAASASAS